MSRLNLYVLIALVFFVGGLGYVYTTRTNDGSIAQTTYDALNNEDINPAVSQLHVAQRDNQRKSDIGRLASVIINEQANNAGRLPVELNQLEEVKEIKDGAVDSTYKIFTVGDQISDELGAVVYAPGYICSEDGQGLEEGSRRAFALITPLENGDRYCIDS